MTAPPPAIEEEQRRDEQQQEEMGVERHQETRHGQKCTNADLQQRQWYLDWQQAAYHGADDHGKQKNKDH
ncbi:hypothetical protein [Noviherbaspirillum sp. Root189]|uniref:hypothetical protein n=1 Tax=Noviherbaspirillum sp. Root189 TaxID=1736487 RepID=UPI000708CD63|nr:hypothetical protein [Noviherbaspirillum sp. Root189]KRB67797.1 hypothetical protein ASE07_08990 [Noviherbaspirillum sp. Root189]